MLEVVVALALSKSEAGVHIAGISITDLRFPEDFNLLDSWTAGQCAVARVCQPAPWNQQ